jgi:DNA-binding response OmpR family regulator
MSGALSILVIDDEDTLRERVMRMLTFEGFEVRGAADGRAGVELAWEYPPDLVICDLLMPGINGFGVCRVLRDDPRTADVPVIVLTALSSQSDRERTHGLGANAYVTKPFRAPVLIAAVRKCLGQDGVAGS